MRAVAAGALAGTGITDEVVGRAGELGVLGWVREAEDGSLLTHAEGPASAVEELVTFLSEGPAGTKVTGVEVEEVKPEGHEQFAVRGVSAGAFVVQEHQASTHHFDLRLEVDGVMRSWAVPKGPSMDPRDKRLAMEVDGHTISSGYREGDSVIVWDRGTYENLREESMEDALDSGHASFWLEGEKLHGGWSLRRIDGRRWLLVKRRDEHADAGDPVTERPESVVSGRTI